MKKLTQREIWEKIAEQWNLYRQKPLQEAIDFLKNKKGKVLDLGCGSGRHLINNPKLEFYEVDFSEEMIKFAKQNAEKKKINANFSVADASKLPFEDNFFNYAIYIAALHCIDSEQLRKESLKELFRVLRPKSQALIIVWSKNHVKLIDRPKNATITWKKQTEELQRYYYLYEKEELKELLEKVGFKIVSIEENKNIVVIVEKK